VHIRKGKTRKTFPWLYSVLENPDILKTGVGVSGDVRELEKDFEGLEMNGVYELQEDSSVCWYMRDLLDFIEEGGHVDGREIFMPRDYGDWKKIPKGLKTMTEEYCGLTMQKSKSLSLYNWETLPLPDKQVTYAAIDAFAGLLVYHELQRHLSILANEIGLNQASLRDMWRLGVDEAKRLKREELDEKRKKELEKRKAELVKESLLNWKRLHDE
jgi:hypothetical protein